MAFIYYVTQIQIDFGAVALLPEECARSHISRPLIVTDAGVKAAGVLQKVLDALPGMPVAVFDQTPSNPTEAAVRVEQQRQALVGRWRVQPCRNRKPVARGNAEVFDPRKLALGDFEHARAELVQLTRLGGTEGVHGRALEARHALDHVEHLRRELHTGR